LFVQLTTEVFYPLGSDHDVATDIVGVLFRRFFCSLEHRVEFHGGEPGCYLLVVFRYHLRLRGDCDYSMLALNDG
jgi:hypothetical protein